MGRVPFVLSLMFSASVLSACAPDVSTPPPPPGPGQADEAVRDAGDAAREAMKKAGDALRMLSGKPVPEEAPPALETPAADASKEPAPAGVSAIAPVPDETERMESELGVQRDASVATQEAAERLVEATRRAAERMRNAGKGVVNAFRKEDGTATPDAPAAPEPTGE